MDLVKSVSKYLEGTPGSSLATRWLVRLRKRSNSSFQTQESGFTPFWEKAETTGIMKLKELLCPKHKLQAWKSKYGVWAFICADCETAFYITEERFKGAWTREDPDLAEFRVHWWEEGKEPEIYNFFTPRSPGNTGVLGLDY